MKQLFHITPFDAAKSEQPVLSMRVGEKYCSFAIVDFASQQLKQLAYYGSEEINENFLTELFRAYNELNIEFYQVLICYDYPWSTLVPEKYYKHEDAVYYLKALHGINGAMNVLTDELQQQQLYNIYAVPKDIQTCLQRHFPKGKYLHTYSIAVKNIGSNDSKGTISIDLRTNDFTLIAASENKIILTQHFCYVTPSDVLYFLLKVCQQLNLSQKDVKLVLSGLIEKQSALYKDLYQYFINVEFREVNWNVADTQEAYPAHFFTSLNELSQCAL